MKKLLLAMPVALCIGLVSCSEKGGGGMSDKAKKNLDAMHAIQKMLETKDFSKVGDYMADSAVDHNGMNGEVKGLAANKEQLVKMGAMTEGDKTDIIKELADDDYVMSWGRYSGKAKTADFGMKPGQTITMESIEVARFKDGKAVEHWTMMEMKEAMKMMPMDQPMVDTVKKMESPKK